MAILLNLDTRQARRDSAMPLLSELYWLPVRHRVSYKIAELTFKALHLDLSPPYLQQCVQIYSPARSLRSASSYTQVQSRSHSAAGDCTYRPRGCHSLECVTCLCYLQRLTAIIQISLEDLSLCIGIHVTSL